MTTTRTFARPRTVQRRVPRDPDRDVSLVPSTSTRRASRRRVRLPRATPQEYVEIDLVETSDEARRHYIEFMKDLDMG